MNGIAEINSIPFWRKIEFCFGVKENYIKLENNIFVEIFLVGKIWPWQCPTGFPM